MNVPTEHLQRNSNDLVKHEKNGYTSARLIYFGDVKYGQRRLPPRYVMLIVSNVQTLQSSRKSEREKEKEREIDSYQKLSLQII